VVYNEGKEKSFVWEGCEGRAIGRLIRFKNFNFNLGSCSNGKTKRVIILFHCEEVNVT
jgi:hypothetical protein